MPSKLEQGHIKLTLTITDLIKLCWSDAEWPKYMKLLYYYATTVTADLLKSLQMLIKLNDIFKSLGSLNSLVDVNFI